MTDPEDLAASITSLITRYPPEHRLHQLAQDLAKRGRQSTRRRAAILKQQDLAQRLTQPPLDHTRPERWNGWIPPRIALYDEDEILRSPAGRINQRGHRSRGELENDSPRRAALLELAAEAWTREHPEPVTSG